jgi:hypothetical protein
MQVTILNKKEKEELVVKLHQENKTIRQIAEIVHMSFKDIGMIIRRIDGDNNDKYIDTRLSTKSKPTQALYLFEHGKKPIDVAIELDIPYGEVEELQQEYWALKELYDLAFVYLETKNYLPSFTELFKLLKQNKMLGKKQISKLLVYVVDLPLLESKTRRLRSEIIDLEFKKKDLADTLTLQNAQLLDLSQTIIRYQNAIDGKQLQLMRIT